MGGNDEPEFLPPEEAFKLSLVPRTDGNLEARFTIAKDYYLYRDKITFKVTDPAGVRLPASICRPRRKRTIPISAR
jgi:thioredoxin:protein disulfide reductase